MTGTQFGCGPVDGFGGPVRVKSRTRRGRRDRSWVASCSRSPISTTARRTAEPRRRPDQRRPADRDRQGAPSRAEPWIRAPVPWWQIGPPAWKQPADGSLTELGEGHCGQEILKTGDLPDLRDEGVPPFGVTSMPGGRLLKIERCSSLGDLTTPSRGVGCLGIPPAPDARPALTPMLLARTEPYRRDRDPAGRDRVPSPTAGSE